ncbi:MAG: NAD(P)H-hydrate dehydratase [Bacteroidales bacterium]|nr:NAD(P)H-hydrate dehydratase [Bacteroidales bacterium]
MLEKIFPIEKIREADLYTIKNEPIASVDLMERAANECFVYLSNKAKAGQGFIIFCGPGNNGGDGLVIARLLSKAGFQVEVVVLNTSDRFSADFQINLDRLNDYPQIKVEEINTQTSQFPEFAEESIIIDALFGSGLNKELKGIAKKLIIHINKQPNIKVAIDVPSGLFADQSSQQSKATILQADYTLSFQFPKLAFLMPENELYVGQWKVLPIGLSEAFIDKTDTSNFYLSPSFIHSLLKTRNKFSHKGSYGHVLMIAGDHIKMGAALLSSKAALRVGAGLITLHHPASAQAIVPASVPEVMSSLDENEQAFTKVPDLAKYTHIAIGPGLGTRPQTAKALKLLIQQVETPMVFDADAINILAENKTWLSFLPKSSILTPHIGEFERLVGKSNNDFIRMEMARDFAKKYQVYLVVKGAHSLIATPTGKVFFNSTGNPGMATGGSGDVLTGMIVGLLAQSYSPLEAALIGVFLHGLAGDLAAEKLGVQSLLASDILDHIGTAYQFLSK